MKARLIKTDTDNFVLQTIEGIISGTLEPTKFEYKLSLKNCQAVENGYDLMKLAEENSHKYYDVKTTDWHCNYNGFFSGFQKALEILGDINISISKDTYEHYLHQKKLQDANVTNPYSENASEERKNIANHGHYLFNNLMNELAKGPYQQTEWDVEVNPDEKDSDGCLILRRI